MKYFGNPKTRLMRFVNLTLRLYLISFIAGCAPTKPPATVAEARSMETRTVDAKYNQVLKASLNVLQDLYYSVDVVEADFGLIQASRHTEGKQAKTVKEEGIEEPLDWKKVCGIAAVAVLFIGFIALLTKDSGSDDDDGDSEQQHYFHNNDDSPSGPVVYKYKVTINLEMIGENQTKVRVSAQGERLVGGSVVSAGPVQEPEFFQRFFASLDKSLFLVN